MANSAACSSISAITQRLKRQSLLTPTSGIEQRFEDVSDPSPIPPPIPPPRRSAPPTEAPKSKPRTKFQRNHKEFGDVPAGSQSRPIPDENAGPSPLPRPSLARPVVSKSLPRPTQSSGMPRLSVRAFQALPSSPNGPGLAELPTGGATVRRELSNSACEARAGSGSPLLAPPVKRFCRSLTEGLPKPKPLRPAATNTAGPAAPSEDHMRSLIAARRLHRTAASEDSALPPTSCFVPYPRGGIRASGSSGYGSTASSLLESTLGVVEPELAEIEAQAAGGVMSSSERPHAPSPGSRDTAFGLPAARHNPAVFKEKLDGDKVYRLVGGKYVVDCSKTSEDFFPQGSCRLLTGPPVVPVPGVWVPSVQEDSEGEEREEEEEDEVTLREESRRSSRGDFNDLDLDSMEKDDSWPL